MLRVTDWSDNVVKLSIALMVVILDAVASLAVYKSTGAAKSLAPSTIKI